MKKNPKRSTGVDIAEISRFRKILAAANKHQMQKLFSAREITYCLSYKKPAEHFAGLFVAKEAASKALGTAKYPFITLEIRHGQNGAPEVWQKAKKLPVAVSISHTNNIAIAVALV